MHGELFTKNWTIKKWTIEDKEFTIQNMERLYVELENIIKDNMKNYREQLLSLEQFDNFMATKW